MTVTFLSMVAAGINARSLRRAPLRSKTLDQAGIDQQPIETPRFSAAGAEIEQTSAAIEDSLLLHEGRIERHTRAFQYHQGQVGRIERIERRRKIEGLEVQPFERVVRGEIARIARQDALSHLGPLERRLQEALGE